MHFTVAQFECPKHESKADEKNSCHEKRGNNGTFLLKMLKYDI